MPIIATLSDQGVNAPVPSPRGSLDVPGIFAQARRGDAAAFGTLFLAAHGVWVGAGTSATRVDLLAVASQLRPGQRRCLVLRYLCGLSTREIAAVMRRTDSAVMGLLYSARLVLGKAFPAAWSA